MSDIVFYKLVRDFIPEPKENETSFCTAAVWSCQLCSEIIDGMGGPGNGELCEKCGTDILNGHIKYARAAMGESDEVSG